MAETPDRVPTLASQQGYMVSHGPKAAVVSLRRSHGSSHPPLGHEFRYPARRRKDRMES